MSVPITRRTPDSSQGLCSPVNAAQAAHPGHPGKGGSGTPIAAHAAPALPVRAAGDETKDEYFARQERGRAFENHHLLTPPKLLPVATYGILGEIIEEACKNTEAVPSTVAINILARFAASIGRTAHIQIGNQVRYLNFNALIVGPTSKGRKGTSAEVPAQLFRLAEQLNGIYTLPLQEVTSLSTGEGLIRLVRDPQFDDESGKCIDKGIADKRLLCDISEFAGTLTVAARKENTLSAVLRDAFDGRTLSVTTKTTPNRSTGSHIVVIGSIPEYELVKCLSNTDIANGLANRFGMFYSTRNKLVADPRPVPPEKMQEFAEVLRQAAVMAAHHGLVQMDEEAIEAWESYYQAMNEDTHEPVIGKLLGREELYTRIFAALLALLNRQTVVTTLYLEAARAWCDYWRQSLNFIFSTSKKNAEALAMKEFKDVIVELITELGGKKVRHGDLTKKLTNNYAANSPVKKEHVEAAMESLLRESPPRIVAEEVTTGQRGRPAMVYTLSYYSK